MKGVGQLFRTLFLGELLRGLWVTVGNFFSCIHCDHACARCRGGHQAPNRRA